jgi:glyoxylase-like metal-dependent hydrolase (beta-lactamase superfamily II)
MAATAVLVLTPLVLTAQVNMDTVQIRAQQLAPNLYVLFGNGGNIGVSVGSDGAFIVDDQFAPLSEKIRAAIAKVTDKPVRFVVNTHWHGDHVGGNENFGVSGAVIVAHENVRKRMSVEQFMQRGGQTTRTPPSATAALPVITFTEDVTLHLNGDSIHVVHVPPAHTDGDAIIHYVKANAIHMGDTFFAGRYPFIDVSTGGTVDGIIGAADRALALANDDTKIIPGHGPVSTKKDLEEFRRVISLIRNRVQAMVVAGKSQAEIAASKPSAEWDAVWGTGFISPALLVDELYTDLKARFGKK